MRWVQALISLFENFPLLALILFPMVAAGDNGISSSCSNGQLEVRGHLTMSLVCEGPVQGDDAAFESHVFEVEVSN